MNNEIHRLTENLEVCQHTECSMKETCLRAQIYDERVEADDIIRMVNPSRALVGSEQCPYYQTWEQVTAAYGFIHLKELLPPYIFNELRVKLLNKFGEKPYYAKRNGKMPLSPEDQQYIIDQLTQQGFSLPEGRTWFDRYEEMYRLKSR